MSSIASSAMLSHLGLGAKAPDGGAVEQLKRLIKLMFF